MSTERWVKPRPADRVVAFPQESRPLSADGECVEWSRYWVERVQIGHVVEFSPEPEPEPAPAPKPKRKRSSKPKSASKPKRGRKVVK